MSSMLSVDQNLAKAGVLMYDIECIAAIPEAGKIRNPSLQYCGGWEDYEGMGISVIACYDFVEAEYCIYLQDNMDDFKTLVNSRNILAGFNNRRFDNNVIRAEGFIVPDDKSYDVWDAIVSTQLPGDRKGFDLNSLLIANGLKSKTGLGSDAPMLAQTGKWGKLINYNLGDTKKQVQILRLACAGLLKNPKNNGYMTIKPPWEIFKNDGGGLFN
jgi:hypothetical protein